MTVLLDTVGLLAVWDESDSTHGDHGQNEKAKEQEKRLP
jgi:hypothetical protein